MKQILYELGASVGEYRYVIENLSYAMEEIKERVAQQKYALNRSGSSRILFGSDSEDEAKNSQNVKRSFLETTDEAEIKKRIKQE